MLKTKKRRRTPKAFVRRYLRVMIGGSIIALLIICAVFAPLICKYDPSIVDMANTSALPSSEHLFGTDVYGRDLFAQVVYGTRVTLLLALGVQFFAVVVGAVCGLLCGYFRRVDTILMRIMEGLHSIPMILLAMVLTQALGKGVDKLMIALVVAALPGITRMTRSQVLSLRQKEFIESEKAMGASSLRIIFLHVLPSCSHYLIIRCITGFSGTILATASLSFLGVGLDPSIPNWGSIISRGQGMMLIYPHLIIYPGIAISLTVFAFSMFGEGMREIMDPKLK